MKNKYSYLSKINSCFNNTTNKCLLMRTLLLFFLVSALQAQNSFPTITKDKAGKIIRTKDNSGNEIPDFSFAGYRAGEYAIPDVAVKAFVPNISGDATATIQAAIDYVAALKPDAKGFRGAVLLDKGIYKVSGVINMKVSGIVLRGSGAGNNGTSILGTGTNREAILTISGADNRVSKDKFQLTRS